MSMSNFARHAVSSVARLRASPGSGAHAAGRTSFVFRFWGLVVTVVVALAD